MIQTIIPGVWKGPVRHNYTSYNNNGDNYMLMYPNTNIPVRFFSSDFILVPPQSRRPTIAPRSISRVRYTYMVLIDLLYCHN
jgi:hypothetical protein